MVVLVACVQKLPTGPSPPVISSAIPFVGCGLRFIKNPRSFLDQTRQQVPYISVQSGRVGAVYAWCIWQTMSMCCDPGVVSFAAAGWRHLHPAHVRPATAVRVLACWAALAVQGAVLVVVLPTLNHLKHRALCWLAGAREGCQLRRGYARTARTQGAKRGAGRVHGMYTCTHCERSSDGVVGCAHGAVPALTRCGTLCWPCRTWCCVYSAGQVSSRFEAQPAANLHWACEHIGQ